MITIEKTKYPMSDDLVRRKLFWLLQRLSSYTLWQRKRDAWAYFVQKYEEALKTWPEDKSDGFHPKNIIWAALLNKSGERSEFCVTLKILQRHHIIQSPLKING
jgi:hypothetical protein